MLETPVKLQRYQTYIDGEWVDASSGKTLETFDPYTGRPWAMIPECDETDVGRAVDAAHRAWKTNAPDCLAYRKTRRSPGQRRGARQREADFRDGGTDPLHAGMVLLLWRPCRQDPGCSRAGRPARTFQLHPQGARRG